MLRVMRFLATGCSIVLLGGCVGENSSQAAAAGEPGSAQTAANEPVGDFRVIEAGPIRSPPKEGEHSGIELDFHGGKLTGNPGCAQLTGNYRFQESKLTVDHFAASNPCPGESLAEQHIVEHLFESGATWHADGDQLQLDSGQYHLRLTNSPIPTAAPAR